MYSFYIEIYKDIKGYPSFYIEIKKRESLVPTEHSMHGWFCFDDRLALCKLILHVLSYTVSSNHIYAQLFVGINGGSPKGSLERYGLHYCTCTEN